MNENPISRRDAIGGTLLMAGAGLASSGVSGAPTIADLDLENPVSRARIRAKISGSTIEETVHGLSQLHLYTYLNGGNVKPLMTLWNYTVTKWEPHSATSYRMRHYESGIYTKFNTTEVLTDYWDNPITGERRKVWPFLSGPIRGEIGPDGMVTGEEATVKPESLGIHVVGDQVFIPLQSSFSFPNPFPPDKYPKESAGPTFYWDSFFTHSALLKDVVNPKLHRVNSSSQFQNLVSWHPWLGMGGVDGRSFGRAFGTKLQGYHEVPEFLQAAIKVQTPEMLDTDSWGDAFRNDFEDYYESTRFMMRSAI